LTSPLSPTLRSERLRALLACVPDDDALADIACDHAQLAIAHLLRSPRARAIACDLNEAPLAVARHNAIKRRVTSRLDLRLADGLLGLQPGESQSACLAGIGGGLIVKLLERGHVETLGLTRLILQPNIEPEPVRAYIDSRGWHLFDERLVVERGIFYTILLVAPQEQAPRPLDEVDVLLGPHLRHDHSPVVRAHFNCWRARYLGILHHIAPDHPDRAQHEQLLAMLDAHAPS
jgi:tRNA (adenine22-N1)-methyltransferase